MRLRVSLLGGILLALGCSGGNPNNHTIQRKLALQSFETCTSLEKYIEDQAVSEMRSTLEQYKTWWGSPVFLADGRAEGGGSSPPTASPTAGAGSADANSGGAPSSYTTTNTQVAGVDEADFVKNDGTRIFVLSGNRLYVNQSWPADQLATRSSLEIEGWPREMFLDEHNRVVVFSNVYDREIYAYEGKGDIACLGIDCGYYYANSVKVTVVDVSDLASPQVTREYYLPGSYANSRRIGSSVRVVLSDNFRWPQGMKWWLDYNPMLTAATSGAAWDLLMQQNEALIRAQTLEEWLPAAKRKLADGTLVDLSYNCSDFYRNNAPTQLGLATIATLNLDQPDTLTRTSIVAQPGEIYASHTALYVANQHWWWWPEPGQQDYTYFHKFDITQPDRAVYLASGGAPGHIVDQFSIDEHQGHLRVATNIATRGDDNDRMWQMNFTNKVSVLAEKEGALVVVGQTPELAPGERIQSSRFLGNKGYVVTFLQIDPLFTLDLSDPTNPRVVGELKVPGFSSYIHPLGDTHLLTIGVHVPEDQTWTGRSLKLSIFDVSDLANPRETFTQLVGTWGSYSEAQHEHKAFNYYPEKKLLAIPFADWSYSTWNTSDPNTYWSRFISQLKVFHVDTATGFTSRGAISMSDVFASETYRWDGGHWTYYYTPAVRRSVMADDFVYAITDAGIRVANISSLSTPVKTVSFQRYEPAP